MKYALIICACFLLHGCGSTRQDVSQSVEHYSETTTAPDGQVTTKIGQRTIDSHGQSETKLDATPPSFMGQVLGLVSGIVGGPIMPALLSAIAAFSIGHGRASSAQSDERKSDLEELWQMQKNKDQGKQ